MDVAIPLEDEDVVEVEVVGDGLHAHNLADLVVVVLRDRDPVVHGIQNWNALGIPLKKMDED